MTYTRSATASACRTCCSTSRTPTSRSIATWRTVFRRRCTTSGARPSDNSSARSSDGRRAQARAPTSTSAARHPKAGRRCGASSGASSGKIATASSCDDACQPQIVSGRQTHEHRALLGDERQPSAGAAEQRRAGRSTAEDHLARQWWEVARQRQQRGGLAGAVRADQRDHLAPSTRRFRSRTIAMAPYPAASSRHSKSAAGCRHVAIPDIPSRTRCAPAGAGSPCTG